MHNGLGIEVLSGRGYGRKYGQGGAAAKLPRGHGDLRPGRECDALARNACELVHTAGVA